MDASSNGMASNKTATQAVMVLACQWHAGQVEAILDAAGVPDWELLPSNQARRTGFLQCLGRHGSNGSRALLGFGPAAAVLRATESIERARAAGTLCPECTAYVWDVRPAVSPHTGLDPVCDEVVDCERALSLEYEGRRFCFCSEACRQKFLALPALYVRALTERHINRRDVVPRAPAETAHNEAIHNEAVR